MKSLFIAAGFLFSIAGSAQTITGKTGILDYGNPSFLFAPKGVNIELALLEPGYQEVAFSNDGYSFYVKNPDTYIFKYEPQKQTLTGWSLISEQKEDFNVGQLPLSRRGREILSLFASHYPLHAYSSNKKGRNGWETERWINADLKLILSNTYNIKIVDTTGKSIAAFQLPDFFSGFNENYMKQANIKPRDFDIDMTFFYDPQSANLFISADCGKYAKGYNRLWMYQVPNHLLTEIPFYTTHEWDNGNNFSSLGKIEVSFWGNYIIRKYFTEFHNMKYEFLSTSTGKLAAAGSLNSPAAEGQDNRVLAFLPEKNEVIVFNCNMQYDPDKRKYKIDYYDTTLTHLVKSVQLDLGKVDSPDAPDRYPIAVSNNGKFFAFTGIYKHPDAGTYLSVNYDLLDDAQMGYLKSITDKTIHTPLINQAYSTADFERNTALIADKQKAIEKLKGELQLTLDMINKRNNQLTELYYQNRLDELLTQGDIWKIDRVSYDWSEPAPEGVLNGPTTYSLGVSYEVTFQKSSVSLNYVNMQCREQVEARKDYSLLNQEENIYGESYYPPTAGSHTLIRNPNYRYGHTYLTFDKPGLDIFLEKLGKSTDLFNSNKLEITTQNQLGIPVVVLRYYYRDQSNAPLYLYQQEILQWLHDYNYKQKEMNKLAEELKKIGN
ncbi:MAG: hypothetical protein JST17_00350 [Bacteroidetes bacterium]|nr:hypothetical protein [Bacteroidota bacterium]MBS1931734.1 hypothetical protein [Bacteroidota bacterium]